MKVVIKKDAEQAGKYAAEIISGIIRKKPAAVIGLATGSTPLVAYGELARMHREDGLDFSRVTTFNLDEYVGVKPDNPASYRYFMEESLFKRVNLKAENTNVPDGMAPDISASCAGYEKKIAGLGGIDIQLLGIGGNGHIAFNEPGSDFESRTRLQKLDGKTIEDNSRFFGNDPELVPKSAVTMGIGTIMEAKKIILVATGSGKADAVRKSLEGPVTKDVPGSALRRHPDVTFVLDEEAAAKIKKIKE